MGSSLRSITNSNIVIRDFSKLGRGLEGWGPKRLFSVHDLAPQRRQILSQARATRPVRLSDLESARHRECAGVRGKQNSDLGYGRRDGTGPRAAAGRILGNCRQAATRQKNAHGNPIRKIRAWTRVFPAPGVMAYGSGDRAVQFPGFTS
jgi:hypothetical protein